MKEQLTIKLMKMGVPRKGTLKIIKQLDDDQLYLVFNKHDYLKHIINAIYYKKST